MAILSILRDLSIQFLVLEFDNKTGKLVTLLRKKANNIADHLI